MKAQRRIIGGLALLIVLGLLLPLGVGAVGLGVYFDTGAMTNCLPEISSYPYITTGYIIATECGGNGGVKGWECKVSWDSTLVVSGVGISGQPINIGTFPEYIVGLGSPLPESDRVVLAELAIVATSSGGIYLDGLGLSVPDSFPAILFAEGLDPVPASFRYGGWGMPVATIGELNCPEMNFSENELVQGTQGSPMGELVQYFSNNPGRLYTAEDGALFINPRAEVAFEGEVVSAERICRNFSPDIREASGILGAMAVNVDVSRVLFGEVPARVMIYVLGYDYPGLMRYAEDWGVVPEGEVVPGVECVVGAVNYLGTYLVGNKGSFVVVAPGSEASLEKLTNKYYKFSPAEQLANADVVVDAQFVSSKNRQLHFRVVRKIKGVVDAEIIVEWFKGMRAWAIWEGREYVVRLYLKSHGPLYRPVSGRYSLSPLGVLK